MSGNSEPQPIKPQMYFPQLYAVHSYVTIPLPSPTPPFLLLLCLSTNVQYHS